MVLTSKQTLHTSRCENYWAVLPFNLGKINSKITYHDVVLVLYK